MTRKLIDSAHQAFVKGGQVLLILSFLTSANLNAQHRFEKIEYYNNPIYLKVTNPLSFYKISLNADGTGKIMYSEKYDTGSSTANIHEFVFSERVKIELNSIFNENRIIETENQFDDEKEFENTRETEFAKITYANIIPEGSLKPVVLKTMSTPLFPKKEVKERLGVFYDKIKSAVPKEIWDSLKAERDHK